jgi:hypothetical protein
MNGNSPSNKPNFLYLINGMRHSIGIIDSKAFAYKVGPGLKNNIPGWYQGEELGLFDNYIILLVQKLKDCDVFGVSGD